jgi:hypothetical protein
MDEVLEPGLKDRAEEINQKVVKAVENPGKFRSQNMTQELEEKALKENKRRWREEFDKEIQVIEEKNSAEEKASRAEPGRPAIILE